MPFTYRPEIDGLRAFAVIPVILFHAGFGSFSGGYIGVDVFFVISGYLITSIILSEYEQGTFSFKKFYERRARRILPALFLVMIVCLYPAWLWLSPEDLTEFGKSLVAVTFFVSNFHFWQDSGYFDSAAEMKPLLHTWSLAVEEQFYILFPPLVIVLWNYLRAYLTQMLVTIALVSLVFAYWSASNYPLLGFFLLPARAWELMLGALAAIYLLQHHQSKKGLIVEGMGVPGLFMITVSVFAFDELTPYPSVYALLPCVGTALIILYSQQGTLAAQILSWQPFVAIGLISYCAYLWHQPLFAFARHQSLNAPTESVMLILIVITFALAYVSWVVLETPVRKRYWYPGAALGAVAVTACVVFVTFGLYSIGSRGMDWRMADSEGVYNLYFDSNEQNWEDNTICEVRLPLSAEKVDACLATSPDEYFVLIGDSHADALSLPLRHVLEKEDIGLLTFTESGCLPIPDTIQNSISSPDSCMDFKRQAFGWLDGLNPGAVVLAARWTLYFEGTQFDNGEGGVEFGSAMEPAIPAHEESGSSIGGQTDILSHTIAEIEKLAELAPIIVLDQIPEAGWDVSGRIRNLARRGITPISITTSYDAYLQRNEKTNTLVDSLSAGISVVRPQQLVCNAEIEGRCENTRSTNTLYRDDDHPSYYYGTLIAESILENYRRD